MFVFLTSSKYAGNLEKVTTPLLLVEDSEDDAFFFRKAFERTQIGCGHLADASKAIEYFKKMVLAGQRPCALVVDLRLRVEHGADVIAVFRSYDAFAGVPIIGISGYYPEEDLEIFRKSTGALFMTKPSDLAGGTELAVTVEKYISMRS